MQHDEILRILDNLLRIPSVSTDIPELERVMSYIEGYFAEYENAVVNKYTFNEKPCIIIQNFDGMQADKILNGHLDVVPPSEEGQFDPFEKDGKIYARGSGDMKSGVALMMAVMKEVFETQYQDKKIALMITSDEEEGGENGVKKLVELGYSASECVLIPDSGSLEEITIAEKGIIDIDVEIFGKSSHSSRPWLGDNAIEKTFSLYKDIKTSYEETDKLTAQNEYWGSSVQLTMIQGGTASNVVPENVAAHFNIRLTETYEDQEKFIQEVIKKVESYDGKITKTMTGNLVHTPESTPVVQTYLTKAQEVTGKHTLRFTREHGASDGRYFAELGVPVILHRPDTDFIHTAGEYVVKQAIFDIFEIYRAFIFDK